MGKKYKFMPSKEYLVHEYFVLNKTYKDIASQNNINPVTVFYWFKKFGIKPRPSSTIVHKHTYTDKERARISKLHKGKTVSDEARRKISESRKIKGIGHEKLRDDGYIAIYYPTHPMSNSEGYVMKHRLIMSQFLKRNLDCDEVVHHKNKNKKDNRIENLMILTKSEHASLHAKERFQKGEVE